MIPALTGLRFVAALLVYMSHMDWRPSPLPPVVADFAISGFNGVTLFFVLSGFVICYNYYDVMRAGVRRALVPFLVARFARIYPMYFLTFVWVFSTVNLNWQVTHGYAEGMGAGWHQIIDQVTMTQAWYSNVMRAFNYNTVAWSVSVEAFLYLTFPIIAVFLLPRLHTVRQHLALCAAAAAMPLGAAVYMTATGQTFFFGVAHYVLYRFPAMRVPDFLLGCLVARLYVLCADRPITRREARFGGAGLALATLAVVGTMAIPFAVQGPLVPFRYDAAYVVPFAVGIFCLARYTTVASRALATPVIVLLGEASYSFYLLHALLLRLLRDGQDGLGTKTTVLHHAVLFVLICAFAIGAYRCIEDPLRRRIRTVLTRRPRPVAAATVHEEPVVILAD